MNVTFSQIAWTHYVHWQVADKKMLKRVNRLIKECQHHPFEGAGKPEPLKGNLSGYWSRRIDQKHRLVYKATHDSLIIVQCRYHY